MICIKANSEIVRVYQRIIMSMKERVEWNGDIIIRKNTMILVGRVRSLYFELATRRVYSDIEELEFDSADAFEMGSNKLITNIINMLLYPFGKWGAIKGLNVEQDYMVLAALFSQIFKEIDVETYFTKTSLKFFIAGIQITFEDAMEKCIRYIEKQQEAKNSGQNIKAQSEGAKKSAEAENNKEATSEKVGDEKKNLSVKEAGERKGDTEKQNKYVKREKMTDDNKKSAEKPEKSNIIFDDKKPDNSEKKHGAGLWHNMKWSVGNFEFKREQIDDKYANSHRIGNNFYAVPYKCPECDEHLHMVVYPQGKENVIDTDDGRVYITRAYTCDNCKRFYTARPGKLLREGEVYVLDFDNDEYAARDYVQLLGKKGAKTGNCNFNMYEADYEKNVSSAGKRLSERCRKMELLTDEELEQILAQMEDGFFSDYEKERFLAIIEQELEYREKMRNKKLGEFGRKSDERLEEEAAIGVDDTADAGEYISENLETVLDNNTRMTADNNIYGESADRETDYAAEEDKGKKSIIKRLMSRKDKENQETTGQSLKMEQERKNVISEPEKTDNIRDIQFENNRSDKSTINDERMETQNIKNRAEDNKNDSYVSESLLGQNETLKAGVPETENMADDKRSMHPDNENSTDDDSFSRQGEKNQESGIKAEKEPEKNGNEKSNDESDNKRSEVNDRDQKKDDKLSEEKQISFFDKLADESRTAKYSEIVENIKKIKASKGDEQKKAHYIDILMKLCRAAAKREIEYMLSHLPGNINFDRYKRTKEKLMTYTEIDVEPYIKIVDVKRDKVEFDELNKLVDSVDRNNRDELLDMMERIKNGEFEKRNSDRFVEGLRKRVYAMDEAKLRGICPNPDEVTFEDGIKALEEIEGGVFLPELKSNMMQLIDKKLTSLKTEECELLVRKLQRDLDGKISDTSKIHFYDIRKMRENGNTDKETSLVKVAVSTYAYATGKYEYPVVICDSSIFGSGKEGFIITPDHIFFKGLIKSGSIDVKNIDGISSEKKGLMVEHSTKGNIKIPCTLNKDDEKNMAEVLDMFIDYLKIKPESRSVEYMSKQEHKVKCCYRCGHVFTEGNICPKCGSRFDG